MCPWESIPIESKSAILINGNTGEILFEHNKDESYHQLVLPR